MCVFKSFPFKTCQRLISTYSPVSLPNFGENPLFRRHKNHNELKLGMFSPGRELFKLLQSAYISFDGWSCRKTRLRRYGCYGNAPPLHFASTLARRFFFFFFFAFSRGDGFHKFEAPFWSPPNSRRLSTNLYFNRVTVLQGL